MAFIEQLQILMTGFPGAPGYMTTYWDLSDDHPPMDDIRSVFGAEGNIWPTGLTLTFPSTGNIIDDVDGSLVSTWVSDAPDDVVGGGTVAYAAPAGACFTWFTGAIHRGRKVQGRSFLVPLDGGMYQTDGTFNNTALGTLNAMAAALGIIGRQVVWCRPVLDDEGGVIASGTSFDVQGGFCRDKVAVLRSRRD